MKVVTMCQGGHVRSVALKYLLRYQNTPPHDVIACGWEGNSPETRAMLFAWADVIVIMQLQFVPEQFHTRPDGSRKLFCYDVGEDRFGTAFHPELQAMLKEMVTRHGIFAK